MPEYSPIFTPEQLSAVSKSSSSHIPNQYFNLPGYGESKYDKSISSFNFATNPSGYLEEHRANSQDIWDSLANTSINLVGKTGAMIEQSIGHLLGVPYALATWDFHKVIDNGWVDAFDKMSQGISEAMPYYRTWYEQQQAAHPGLSYFTSRAFLLDDLLSNGVPFAASAWLTGAFGGEFLEAAGMAKSLGGMLLKATTGAEDLSEASQGVKLLYNSLGKLGLNNLPRTTAAAFNTYTEGAFEARQTYQQTFKDRYKFYKAQVNSDGSVTYSDDYAKQLADQDAVKASKTDLMLNLLTLPLSEYQFTSLFKDGTKTANSLKYLDKQLLEGNISKKLYNTISTLNNVKGLISGGLKEGLQEGLQQSFQDISQQHSTDNGNSLYNFFNAGLDSIKNFAGMWTTPDYLKQEVAGFVMGLPFSMVEKSNEILDHKKGWSNLQSLYGADISKSMMLNTIAKYGFNEEAKTQAKLLNNNAAYNAAMENQMANTAHLYFEAGMGDRLQQLLDLQGKKSIDEWADQGITEFENNQTPEQIANKWKNKVKEYQTTYDAIQKRFPEYSPLIKKVFYDTAVLHNNLKEQINNYSKEVDGYNYENNPVVTELNKLNTRIKTLDLLKQNITESNISEEDKNDYFNIINKLTKESNNKFNLIKEENKDNEDFKNLTPDEDGHYESNTHLDKLGKLVVDTMNLVDAQVHSKVTEGYLNNLAKNSKNIHEAITKRYENTMRNISEKLKIKLQNVL